MEEKKDVNVEEAETSPESTEENEQAVEPVEGVTPPVDGKNYKAIAEQLSRDIQEKNRKIQELKRQPQEATQEEIPQDEVVKRFVENEKRAIRAEANTEIIMKMQSDPTFKNRVDIVKDYVEKGYTIDMADRLAKADIMDKILTELPKEVVKPNQPKQLETQAIPDKNEFQPTGNPLKDLLDDPNVPEAAKEAARRYF